jgi:hypothetical protein
LARVAFSAREKELGKFVLLSNHLVKRVQLHDVEANKAA